MLVKAHVQLIDATIQASWLSFELRVQMVETSEVVSSPTTYGTSSRIYFGGLTKHGSIRCCPSAGSFPPNPPPTR